jgi:hypothetical protein
LTVTVTPAIVSVPVRAAPALGATVKVTVPLSTPPVPDVTEIHDTLLTTDHAQPGEVPTDTDVPVVPAPGTETLDGMTLAKQACETVTV